MKIKSLKKFGILLALIAFSTLPNISFAEANPPSALTGSARNGAVFLQWTNVSVATDHLVEYKQSSESTWNIYPHPASSTPGIVVHNLTNGVSYDFRASTISAEGTSLPTNPISVTPSSNAPINENNQIISTGQSNAIGDGFNTPLSVSQPYSNRMLSAGRTALVPLVEPIPGVYGGIGETMASGLANSLSYFTASDPNPYSSIMSLGAQGAMIYTALMQGTPIYNSLLADITAARDFSVAEGKTHVVRALTVIHGETDEYTPTPAEVYEQYLVDWQNDYNADIKAITGQEEDVILFTDQMNGHQNLGSAVPHIALAQYNAAKNNPDTIIMVTPKYILPTTDWLGHLTHYSQRRLGEYYAKVYKKVIIDGEQWKPLMPEEITLQGNVIRAEFHVPVPPLVFDTAAVMFKANYGFEYTDSTNSAYITNVQIVSPDTVEISLSIAQTVSNPRLRYAYTGTVASWTTGPMAAGSSRGNLRDSDTTLAPHQDSYVPEFMGNYLRNWSLAFDEAITIAPVVLDAPSTVSAVAGATNGTAVVSFTAPTNTGLGPITNYIVTSAPGNIVANGTGSPISVTGLSNNTTYVFTVTAVNSAGQIATSINSNPVSIHWPTIIDAPQKPGTLEPTGPRPITIKPERKSRTSKTITVDPEVLKAAAVESSVPTKEPQKEVSSDKI